MPLQLPKSRTEIADIQRRRKRVAVERALQSPFHNGRIPKDINLCYNEKYKLSDLVYKIKYLTKSDCDVIIYNNQIGSLSYTGDSTVLESLNIALTGIDIGVEKCLKSWSKY